MVVVIIYLHIFSMKVLILAALLVVMLHADPNFPRWADHWQQGFFERYLDPADFTTEGYIWYDFAKKMSRVDRFNGKYDRVCGTVNNQSTSCIQLVRDGKRWVIYPFIKQCCLCCTQEHGCDVLKPDWPSKGFNYEGIDELDGKFYQKWRNDDEKTSYWTTEEEQVPRKISEMDKYFRDHILLTYRENEIPSQVFAAPLYCKESNLCPSSSKCGQFRGEKIMTE